MSVRLAVADLSGNALNWCVGVALGFNPVVWKNNIYLDATNASEGVAFNPIGNWNDANSILSAVPMRVSVGPDEVWDAEMKTEAKTTCARGKTALVAYMRCFVVWVLGPQVSIPEELGKHEDVLSP